MKRLKRNTDDDVIGGVCAGLADYFHFDVSLIRVATVLAAILGIGTPILIYIVLWIIVPED